MNQDGVRKPIRLQQEELISSLPERIGNVRGLNQDIGIFIQNQDVYPFT